MPTALQADSTRSTRSSRHCPDCGGSVKRVLRTATDKRRWDADAWRRYRCRDEHCNWQGLLRVVRRHRPSGRPKGAVAVLARMGRMTLLLLLVAGLAWGGVVALQLMMGL